METTDAIGVTDSGRRVRFLAGIILIGVGLLGHLLAARAISSNPMAYKHHIFGFFLILVVTGAIISALGWRFWKRRTDITVLTIGVVQALIGAVIYINRFNIR
jgi:uncharacterized membrane protein AbrB (regulator of aidB expression)